MTRREFLAFLSALPATVAGCEAVELGKPPPAACPSMIDPIMDDEVYEKRPCGVLLDHVRLTGRCPHQRGLLCGALRAIHGWPEPPHDV